jgi:hypothetical protein
MMRTIYYPVSIPKLLLLSLATFGLYLIFVWYQNFEYIRCRQHSTKSSVVRSVFMIFTVFPLFADINQSSKKYLGRAMPGCFFFALWFFLSLLVGLVGFLFVNISSPIDAMVVMAVNFSGLFALIPLQLTINAINKDQGLGDYIRRSMSLKEMVYLFLGVVFWALMVKSYHEVNAILKQANSFSQIQSTLQLALPKS